MRLICILLCSVFLVQGLVAKQKLEVFALQNRDAESLVPVIANALGPEARVSVDTRTNSLIVSYPEELGENLRTIIAQLDQIEPNIEIEVITIDVASAWLERLGLTLRGGLSPGDYQALLPLLLENREATLVGKQSVVVRNNVPAAIYVGPTHHGPNPNHHSTGNALYATPRLLGQGTIEIKLAQQSPSLASPHASGQVFTTVAIANGGAQVFEYSKVETKNKQASISLFPIGLSSNTDKTNKRLVFLSAKTTDYKKVPEK